MRAEGERHERQRRQPDQAQQRTRAVVERADEGAGEGKEVQADGDRDQGRDDVRTVQQHRGQQGEDDADVLPRYGLPEDAGHARRPGRVGQPPRPPAQRQSGEEKTGGEHQERQRRQGHVAQGGQAQHDPAQPGSRQNHRPAGLPAQGGNARGKGVGHICLSRVAHAFSNFTKPSFNFFMPAVSLKATMKPSPRTVTPFTLPSNPTE